MAGPRRVAGPAAYQWMANLRRHTMIGLKNQFSATFVTAVIGLCLVSGCNNQDERETGGIGGTGAVRGGAGTAEQPVHLGNRPRRTYFALANWW